MTTESMHILSSIRRSHLAARLLVGGLALSLLVTLSPCCELFASALASPAPAAKEGRHDHASHVDIHGHAHERTATDGDAPTPHCGKWADNSDHTLKAVVATFPTKPDPRIGWTTVQWSNTVTVDKSALPIKSTHSPPQRRTRLPLYLSFGRFLI